LRSERIGAAIKIEEYAPLISPTKRAKAKSLRVVPPKRRREATGRMEVREVFTERMRT